MKKSTALSFMGWVQLIMAIIIPFVSPNDIIWGACYVSATIYWTGAWICRAIEKEG